MQLNTVWALANFKTEKKYLGLSFRELCLAARVLMDEELESWYVWQHEWDEWRLLSSMLNSLEYENGVMPILPPALQKRNNDEKPKSDHLIIRSMADELDEGVKVSQIQSVASDVSPVVKIASKPSRVNFDMSVRSKDRKDELPMREYKQREFKRHRKRFVISIEINGHKFESLTKDISVGGMLLKDPVPEWVVGYFTVKVTHPISQQTVEHRCSVVENQDPDHRIRLMFDHFKKEQTKVDLENWLLSA